MALSAADVRFGDVPVRLLAVRAYLHTPLEPGGQGTSDCRAQLQEFTCVGEQNTRNRAGTAKVGAPVQVVRLKQAALLNAAAPIVVPVEILAFPTRGRAHAQTRVTYAPVRVSTRIVSPTLTNCGTWTSRPVSVRTFLVTPVAVSPRIAISDSTTF